VHNNGSSYITSSAACLAACEVQKAKEDKADDERKWAADLEEIHCQKEQFAAMEARLLSLSNPSPTEDGARIFCSACSLFCMQLHCERQFYFINLGEEQFILEKLANHRHL
jgi:hypothetical protein